MESPKTNTTNQKHPIVVQTALPPLTSKEIDPEKSKNSNKISEIVKLKRMLKKWRNQASSSTTSTSETNSKSNNSGSNNGNKKGSLSRSNSIKGITFLKRSLSFTDVISASGGASSNAVKKGFLAVDVVGQEIKRFVIPTSYLSHQAFSSLLKEAEEEFGFQQEGVLKIPCEVEVFENILKVVEAKNSSRTEETMQLSRNDGIVCGSSESQSISQSLHPPSPMCR